MRRLAPFEIDVIYDCLLKAQRHASADYVESPDEKYLRDLKDLAKDLLSTFESIEVRDGEE